MINWNTASREDKQALFNKNRKVAEVEVWNPDDQVVVVNHSAGITDPYARGIKIRQGTIVKDHQNSTGKVQVDVLYPKVGLFGGDDIRRDRYEKEDIFYYPHEVVAPSDADARISGKFRSLLRRKEIISDWKRGEERMNKLWNSGKIKISREGTANLATKKDLSDYIDQNAESFGLPTSGGKRKTNKRKSKKGGRKPKETYYKYSPNTGRKIRVTRKKSTTKRSRR